MKKFIIYFLLGIICIILIDTIQALIFNNSPILKMRALYDGGQIHYIDKGILVDTYKCHNEKKDTVIKGFSYSCTNISDFKIVDTSKNIDNFSCAEILEEIYQDENYIYYLSCMKSKYIEVRYSNSLKENIISALYKGNISINDLDKFNIEYIKYEK